MNARAIWQGTLNIQKHQIAVKLYSAVVDRQIHFHLLHRQDRARVQQQMVAAETDEPVVLKEARRAFEAEPGLYVEITRAELEGSAPDPSHEVRVRHCVPLHAIDPQLYDHPYYLGPSGSSSSAYFALAQALDRKNAAGIASWVMRKHSYVGALLHQQGYLMLVTLRHAEEVIPVRELTPPQRRVFEPKEKELAGQLIETLSSQFDPAAYHDEYQERVRELIDAKRRGKVVKRKRLSRRRSKGTLVDSLQASLKRVSARRRG